MAVEQPHPTQEFARVPIQRGETIAGVRLPLSYRRRDERLADLSDEGPPMNRMTWG